MGTSRSPAELAAKFAKAAKVMQDAERTAVNNAARVASDVMYREAMRSIRGPRIGKAKWGTTVRRATATQNPIALVHYRGPVHWFEKGTKEHAVFSKKFGGSRANRASVEIPGKPWVGMYRGAKKRGAIRTPKGVRAYAEVDGMTARPFHDRATDAAKVPATRELKRSLMDAPLKAAGF